MTRGRFHVAGAPEPALGWGDLAGRLEADGRLAELSAETDFKPAQPTFPFGAHVAVVEVDTETGAVRLVRMIACDDAGTIINPMSPRARSTAVWPPGSPRRCTRRSATTPRAPLSTPTS